MSRLFRNNFIYYFLLIFLIFQIPIFSKETQNEKEQLLSKLKTAKEIEKSAILNKLAKEYWWDKDRKPTLKYGTEALKYAKKFNQEKEKLYSLISLSHIYRRMKKFKTAKKFGKKALKLAKKRNNSKEILDVLITYERIFDFYDFKKNIKRNCQLIKQIVYYAKKSKSKETLALYTHALAGITYRLGDEKKAYKIYLKALELYKKNGNLAFQSHILTIIGGFNRKWKNFENALFFMEKAEKIALKTGNKNKICRVLNGFGRIYFEQKKFEKALKYFKKGLTVANEINDTRWKANFNLFIGRCLVNQGNYKTAIDKFLLEGVEVIKSNKYYVNSEFSEALYLEIGKAFLKVDNSRNAYRYLLKSLTFSTMNQDNEILLSTYEKLGEYFEKIENKKRAEYFYIRGLKIIGKIRDKELKKEFYKQISDFYFKNNNKKLFNKFKKYFESVR